MKTFFTLLFCCLSASLLAQPEIKITNERTGSGFNLYASSTAYCPISVSLNLNLENLNFPAGKDKIFLIPAMTEKFLLGELIIAQAGKKYGFSVQYQYNYGDFNLEKYDTAYLYDLPYKKGKSFSVSQGYNGNLSHQNENAIDFTMPEGTEVVAVREGTVIKVVQNNNQSCATRECQKYNNYVIIYQPDGTISRYLHLRYNGSMVKAGDKVSKGDVIGFSGNTGWSLGPHLHYSCSLPSMDEKKTIQTKFKVGNGSHAEYLRERMSYSKDY